MEDQAYIEGLVKPLVLEPEKVKVERTVDTLGVLLTLRVAEVDLPSVIGREGATAKAMRTLLRVLGAKEKSRISLRIDDGKPPVRKE